MAYRQYREIKKGEFVVVFGDTATGLGDYTAVQFLSKTNIDIPLVFHDPMTTSEAIPTIHRTLERIFDITGIKPVVALERNNGGVFLMDRLAGLNINYKYELFKMPIPGAGYGEESNKLGWDTNTATRPKMLVDYKNAVDNNALLIYDRPTITEMFSFIRVQTNTSVKAQAEKGMHDDLVMSAAGAWQLYQMCEAPQNNTIDDFPEEKLFDDETGLYI